jgi:hypothetical protein
MDPNQAFRCPVFPIVLRPPGPRAARYAVRADQSLSRTVTSAGGAGRNRKEPETIWRLPGLVLACHALGQRKESDSALAEFIARGVYAPHRAKILR